MGNETERQSENVQGTARSDGNILDWSDTYELDIATKDDPRRRMSFWIDSLCKGYEELAERMESFGLRDERTLSFLVSLREETVLRLGSMAMLSSVESRDLSDYLPEILDGMNASVNYNIMSRFRDTTFWRRDEVCGAETSRILGGMYLEWALDYVDRWEKYHSLEWDAGLERGRGKIKCQD